MTHQETGNSSNPPAAQPEPHWATRSVEKIERYFHARAAEKQRENAQDRASRRTANATVAIAFLTVAVVIVGGLQYLIFKGQLKVMADQLEEMKGTGKQTDELIKENKKLAEAAQGQLEALRESGKQANILIDTNKQLADAATKSAQTAEQGMKMAQRAELTIGNFEFQNVAVGQSPIIKFRVGNIGRSPAYITSKPSMIAYVDAMPKSPNYPSNSTNISITGNTNFVIDLDQPRPPAITQELFDQLKAGQMFILVYGKITYRDIFDDVWDLGYAMKYESVKDTSGNMVFRDAVPEVSGFTYLKKR